MKAILYFFLLVTFCCSAQNTVSFVEGSPLAKANLKDVSWMAGHWKGEALGGAVEEIWSPPLGDSMMFVFKLVVDEKVKFYEVGHIQQKDETLVLQLKHFDHGLKGWEEKEETVDFKLVKLEENRVFFDDFTLERHDEDNISAYVVINDGDGPKEITFNFKRAN